MRRSARRRPPWSSSTAKRNPPDLEAVDHAGAEARRVSTVRRVTEQRRRRDRRVAEALEGVGFVRDARRDGVKLRALRQAVAVARRDLLRLAIGKVRESGAAQLLLALLAIGERHRMQAGLELSHGVPIGHLPLEAAQAVDVVGLVLEPLDDAAESERV